MSARDPREWTAESLRARIDRSPFNAWLGLEVLDWGHGAIGLSLRARPNILGHAAIGALHGGVTAAVMDTACSMAVVAATGESVFTVDMRVDYLRPATAEVYTIRAEVVRLGRTLATADARMLTAEGIVVATGRAVLQHVAAMPGAGEPAPE